MIKLVAVMSNRDGWRRLWLAWLGSAACLGVGALLALALGRVHYARGLLVLALVLAAWLHTVELGLAHALAPAETSQPPASTRWLPVWYAGFLLTQGLGLAAGYLTWLALRHG